MEHLIAEASKIRDVKKRRSYLRKRGLTEEEVEQALEKIHLRVKGRDKFPRAARMRFTREGLSQATSKQVAEYRTWKIRERLGAVRRALDVGSGVGGDTIAMALRWKVLSVEMDPEIMEMQRHNVGVYGVERNVEPILGDVTLLVDEPWFREKTADVDVAFFDPSRRGEAGRTVKIEEYIPPLSFVERLREITPNVCVKIAPGVDLSRIGYDCDVEVISYRGEVKEATLWFGDLKVDPDTRNVMATKLPERITLQKSKTQLNIEVTEPKTYLYEPDPAFIKAHLVDELAAQHGLTLLHPKIAYLTGDTGVDTPVLKAYRVLDTVGMDYGEINGALKGLGIGRVD
ncbi:hypothetical protein JXL21_12575, partial [Candidatus Bathyarchaeota archaeon]|nr:hypothetical protein [Candidatus Bathyarchaeota archaeon]